jgi:GTP-binding protein YchF
MSLQAGIIGLPNVGKSSLFNALSKAGAESANYPFCTVDPNVGVVEVPDARLKVLTGLYKPEKTIPATVEFVDIAGLVRGASKGEGLGNQFLSHIREVDALVHVVRCFEDDDVVHVHGKIDPVDDLETIETELIFADLDSCEKQLQKAQKSLKGDKKIQPTVDLLQKIKDGLEGGTSVRRIEMDADETSITKGFFFLTAKPMLYTCNVAEENVASADDLPLVQAVKERAKIDGAEVLVVSAKVEEEIAQLDDEEKAEFLAEVGLKESGLDRLIHSAFRLLGLMTYFTGGPKEVRAWTIKQGFTAPQAAGVIHTDFERGFIRAEVVSYDDLIAANGEAGARDAGKMRLEGKEYIMQDGDVCHFRFSV